jgi:alcohol dehydrogenase class IV
MQRGAGAQHRSGEPGADQALSARCNIRAAGDNRRQAFPKPPCRFGGETHAIILPHVMSFNLEAAPEADARLQDALGHDVPAAAVAAMLYSFPIPKRLRDVGFKADKIDFVANEIAAGKITVPRPASADDVRALLAAAN